MTTAPSKPDRTVQALRVGLAAVITLLVAEAWHLPHANLAVWTTHMIMSSYTHTSFQKGVERFVGRTLGIFLGWAIVALVGEERPLAVAVEVAGLTALFYLFYVGRLAYTYQNAGLYLNATLQMAAGGAEVAYVQGGWMILAIAVGVVVANLVSWTTGAERDLSIAPGGVDPLPIRPEFLARGFQATATLLVAQFVFFALDLPPESNLFTLFLFAVLPDFQQLHARYKVYMAGIVAGLATGVVMILILVRLPHLPVLVGLIFLGMFVASYLNQSPGPLRFVGSEMGQIFTLTVVTPIEQIQSPATTFYILIALVVYLAISWIVGGTLVALGVVPNRPYQPPGLMTTPIRR